MMTDLDVINYIEAQAKCDKKLRDKSDDMISDETYNVYLQGQIAGVRRVMAYLRQQGVLHRKVIDGITHYVFVQ